MRGFIPAAIEETKHILWRLMNRLSLRTRPGIEVIKLEFILDSK